MDANCNSDGVTEMKPGEVNVIDYGPFKINAMVQDSRPKYSALITTKLPGSVPELVEDRDLAKVQRRLDRWIKENF